MVAVGELAEQLEGGLSQGGASLNRLGDGGRGVERNGGTHGQREGHEPPNERRAGPNAGRKRGPEEPTDADGEHKHGAPEIKLGSLEDAVDTEEAAIAGHGSRCDAEGEEQDHNDERHAEGDRGIDRRWVPLSGRGEGASEGRHEGENEDPNEEAEAEGRQREGHAHEGGARVEGEDGARDMGQGRHPEEGAEDHEGNERGHTRGATEGPNAKGRGEVCEGRRRAGIREEAGDAGEETEADRDGRVEAGVREVDGEPRAAVARAGAGLRGCAVERVARRATAEAERMPRTTRAKTSPGRMVPLILWRPRRRRARGWALS